MERVIGCLTYGQENGSDEGISSAYTLQRTKCTWTSKARVRVHVCAHGVKEDGI